MPVTNSNRFLNSFPNFSGLCFPCAQAEDWHLVVIIECQ